MVIQLTWDNFPTMERGIVLIDWSAARCAPCRAFAPVFAAAAARHPDARFAKVDVDAQPELAGTFRVRSVPTVTVLRDGIVLASQSGAVSGDMLDEIVRQVQALDMDAVRRQVRNHHKTTPADRPPGSGEAFV